LIYDKQENLSSRVNMHTHAVPDLDLLPHFHRTLWLPWTTHRPRLALVAQPIFLLRPVQITNLPSPHLVSSQLNSSLVWPRS